MDEREGLGDPELRREPLSEADAQPDPEVLLVRLPEPLAQTVCEARLLEEYVPSPLLAVAQREVLAQLDEDGERLPACAETVESPLPVAAPLLLTVTLLLRVAVPQREALLLTEAHAVEVRETMGETETETLGVDAGEKRPVAEAEAHTEPIEDGEVPFETVAMPAVALRKGVALSEPARPPVGVTGPLLLGAAVALPPSPPPLAEVVALA